MNDFRRKNEKNVLTIEAAVTHLLESLSDNGGNYFPIVLIHAFIAENVNDGFRTRIKRWSQTTVMGKEDGPVSDMYNIGTNCTQKGCHNANEDVLLLKSRASQKINYIVTNKVAVLESRR